MTKTESTCEKNRGLWIIFAFVSLLVLFNSAFRIFNHDEFFAIHGAWKVLNSGAVYADFFKHHHPLVLFMGTPLIAVFGENIATLFILRGMALSIMLSILLVTYLISTKLFDRKTALLSVVLLISARIFIESAIEVRPDTPQVLFGLLSILFLLSFYQNRSRRNLVLSAISLAISLMFLQKAIFLIFLLGSIMAVDIFRKKFLIKDLALFVAVFIAAHVPFYTYIVMTGGLKNYLFFAWLIPMDMPGPSFSPIDNILKTFRRNTVLWAFYFPGLWLVLKSIYHDQLRLRLATLSVALLASVFFVRLPNPQYFMHSIPLIAIISAFALTTFFKANQKRLLIILIIGTIIPAIALAKRPFKKSNMAQLEKVGYVLSITDKNDRVYDPEFSFNFFREDTDFFWVSVIRGSLDLTRKITMTDYNGFDPCESIGKTKPAVTADHILLKDCPYIKADYRRSKEYPDLFIRIKEREGEN